MKSTERASSGRHGAGPQLPWIGERVGPFTVVAELGRGTMGAVYRAHDPAGREVALKVLTPENADAVGLERFEREGRILAALPPHQNLLRVHSMGLHQGLPWLALDLIEGQSLEARLAARGRLSPAEAVPLIRKLCLALDQVHAAGILHRDIKAGNVILRAEDQEPVLTDFGVALAHDAERLTRSGDLLGTPLYMSPEQLLGRRQEVDQQSDVWSLGVLLYHVVTGAHPFPASSLAELARRVHHEDWTPLATHLGRDDPALTRILGRALHKRKLSRYRSAAEMAEDLAAWPELPGRAPVVAPPGWPRLALSGLGVLALALGVALVLLLRARLDGARVERLAAATAALELDLSGLAPAADPDRLAALEEALGRARGVEGEAAGAVRAAAEAQRAAWAADAALRSGDLAGAERHLSALPAGGPRALLTARLALARGEPLDEGPLEALLGGSPAGASASAAAWEARAARLLLSRARRVRDPAAALRLLEEAGDGAGLAEEREVIQALTQLADPRAEAALSVWARGPTGSAHLPELRARTRLLLERSVQEVSGPDAPLDEPRRLLQLLGSLGQPVGSDPLADRVVQLISWEPGKPAPRGPEQRTPLLEALVASGLRTTDRDALERVLDGCAAELATGDDQELFVRAVVTFVALDADTMPSHLYSLDRAAVKFPPGWAGEYLRLLQIASRGDDDEAVLEAKKALHQAVVAGRFPLGPVQKARAIRESVSPALGWQVNLAALQEARALDPQNPWVHVQLAITHEAGSQREEAVRCAEEGIRCLEAHYLGRAIMRWSQESMLIKEVVELLIRLEELGRARAIVDRLAGREADVGRAERELVKAERKRSR